ncbi:MAG TPA: LLM class F420-dependent oxidoreductase [Candidatus Binatia bacterium]|nr:LLM class F420-dependent oxidoreductase [Candidatus Binatia bacterium]
MATHPVRFGIQTGQQGIEWAQMLDLWQKADRWGYDSLWNFDHFYPIFVDPEGPCFEGWTTLSALAQATKRARIGHLVNGNTYRHPCVTAKMAATLDHISGGRLNLGIGAGWFELEHRNFGIDFKTVRGRLEALEEACRIIRGMFTQDKTTVHGKHYTVTDAMCLPKPVQRPHPPIMIGGVGQKVLLRIVAQYADMWNASGSAETLRDLIGVIRKHGDAVKRDTTQIEKTAMMPLCYKAAPPRQDFMCGLIANMRGVTPEEARKQIMIGDKQECLDTVERYTKAGITHFIFMTFAPFFEDEIQGFAEEVIPAVRKG